MKLTSPWVDQTQAQFGVQALPEDHPAAGKLNEVFGEHTFFVGEEGLHIVEGADPPRAETGAREVIKIAGWRDEERSTLAVQEPELVGTVVVETH